MVNQKKIKRSVYIAVEGKSDGYFIAWLQKIIDQKKLDIHLNCQSLTGGGYQKMLKEVKYSSRYDQRNKRHPAILLVDTDRADRKEDGWRVEKLHAESDKMRLTLFTLSPNLEGLFLRLHPGKEKLRPDAITVKALLKQVWPDYYDKVKPADAAILAKRFNFDSLKKVAGVDADLKKFLELIGFNFTE